jgi:Cu/Ag efflux protein CusF
MQPFPQLLLLFGILVFSGSVSAMDLSVTAGPPDEGDELPKEFVSPQHPLAAGQVVATDRAAGTITILHKPIPDVFMAETMTMIFRVTKKSMLENLTAGDKVRFEVHRDAKGYVIVRIENSN